MNNDIITYDIVQVSKGELSGDTVTEEEISNLLDVKLNLAKRGIMHRIKKLSNIIK